MISHSFNHGVDLRDFDVILLNSSAGKDSMAMLDLLARQARREEVLERLTVGHADLGRMDWPGTRQLAETQAARYGLRFEVVAAAGPDLLERTRQRGMWPSPRQRWCTSDLKRGPLRRLMTRLLREHPEWGTRRMRLLNVMGMRAEESPARARKSVLAVDPAASNGVREIVNFLPLHHLQLDAVWKIIGNSRISDLIHPAYRLGMPRLSCRFCILASRGALIRAAKLNPDLAAEYLKVEQETGHLFRLDCSIEEVIAEAESAAPHRPIEPWVG
jgi:3'-phosphoadenosine 5'-phosphosulfate sulfotransferase (PAPS reductase)/FAD synthetase